MPPVAEHPVHPAVMRNAGHLYGCHNRQPHLDTFTFESWRSTESWPNVFTRDCQYSKDPTGYGRNDPGCEGCKWKAAP